MIGIDIGSSTIKLCQVEKRAKGYHFISAITAPNPLLGQQNVKQNAELVQTLKMMAGAAFLASNHTVASIGSSQILARNFTLPRLNKTEIAGAVRFEAEQSISSDINAMYTDFQLLGDGADDKTDVLFIGVPKEEVERHLQVLDAAGLQTEVVDIDNIAMTNCYLAFDPNAAEESAIILDIGHSSTNISVIDEGMLRFIRNVDFGGKDVTNEIARSFGIAPAIAEKMKKRPDLWTACGLNIKSVLRKSTPDLLEAIHRSIDYCMSRKKLINLDKILLTGGTSSLHGLKKFMSEVFGVHTEVWNPLDHMDLQGAAVKRDRGQLLGVAIGLAIRKEKNV